MLTKTQYNKHSVVNVAFSLTVIMLAVYLFDRGSMGYFYTISGSTTMHYSPGHGNGALVVAITSIALALTFLAAFLVSRNTLNGVSKFPKMNLTILIIFALFHSITIVFTDGTKGLLSQTTSSYVYLLSIAVYLGTRDSIWLQVRKWTFVLSTASIAAAFGYSLYFTARYSGRIGNSPQIIYLSTGFWLLAIWALCFKQKNKIEKIVTVVTISLSLIVSVLYVSRGWIIQSLLLILFYVYKANKQGSKNIKFSRIIFLFAVLIGILYLFILWKFPSYFELLYGRLNADTRSWQYREIFASYNFNDIFFGKGWNATYESTSYGDYKYIDNTFVYLMFHYGIPFMLTYAVLLFRATKHALIARNLDSKMCGFVLILWIFALNGLSVYNAQMIDLKCLFIFVLIGRCYKSTVSSFSVVKFDEKM